MDTVFKAFSGIFFLMVLMVSGISLLFASIEAANADSFATAVANRVRASYFDERVIEECKKEADARDYELKVLVYRDGDTHECYGITDVSYVYAIPVFGVSEVFHVRSEMY